MERSRGNALSVLLVALSLAVAALGFLLLLLARRVGELEERLAPGPPGAAATPLALGGEVRALERKVEEAADRAARAEAEAAKASARAEAVDRAAEDLRQRVLVSGEPPPAAAFPKGALEEAVAKAVEEKVRDLPQGGEWKPTLAQFGETLGLSEEQADACERVFDDAKHEAMKLLTLPRPEGGCVLDDLVAAFREPDPEGAAKTVFLGLFTAKIPGRDEPFIAEILRIKERAQQGLDGILDGDQRKRLSRMNIDHLGVQTSFDPFAEYVRDSLR